MNIIDEFMIKIDNIRFLNIDECYQNRQYIKENFQKLNDNEKEMYKWYFFYQLCLLKNPLKSLMWDYLHTDNYKVSIELNYEYAKFCERRNNLKFDKNDNM